VDAFEWIRPYLIQSPLILVYLVGIILSLVYMGSHAKAATFVLLGCLLLLIIGLVVPWVDRWVIKTFVDEVVDRAAEDAPVDRHERFMQVTMIFWLIRNTLAAGAFALIVAAAFVGRRYNPITMVSDYRR
jgi:hypothetical protein